MVEEEEGEKGEGNTQAEQRVEPKSELENYEQEEKGLTEKPGDVKEGKGEDKDESKHKSEILGTKSTKGISLTLLPHKPAEVDRLDLFIISEGQTIWRYLLERSIF